MTATAAIRTPQPLRDPAGTIAAYFVPAAEFDQLQAELVALRAQVIRLQRQKDGYVAQLHEAYTTLIPVPLSDEELNGPIQNPNAVRDILAELEAR